MSRASRRKGRAAWLAGVAALVAASFAAPAAIAGDAPSRVLSVCADPANLPFSDDRGDGFENRIASLLAEELQATLEYTWNPQYRSFLRKTLQAKACDVVVGSPTGLPGLLQTRPYYTSTYVFVTARKRGLKVRGFDDPVLRKLRIGVPALGAEGANTPPVMALARRGIVNRVKGFSVWDRSETESPQSRIVDAVAKGEIDVAVMWGPTAGYFARKHGDALQITAIDGDPRQPELAFRYSMTVGVRAGDEALRDELQRVLDKRASDIDAILRDFGVPIEATGEPARTASLGASPNHQEAVAR